MYYFIPAWYNTERPWYDVTHRWTYYQNLAAFDDMVHQLRMFKENQKSVQLVVLSYSPNLRALMHQQSLREVTYVSCFDEIMQTSGAHTRRIRFDELQWPIGCEFVYSPFSIVVMKENELFANVEFANDGSLFEVIYYQATRPSYHVKFDDRGFVSSTLYFDDDGNPDYQLYYNLKGQWVIKESLSENRVEAMSVIVLNPQTKPSYLNVSYVNFDGMVQDWLTHYNKTMAQDDTIVIASHLQHNAMFDALPQSKVYSFFKDRYPISAIPTFVSQEFMNAKLVVVDRDSTMTQFANCVAEHEVLNGSNILKISPYDTRLSLGESARRKIVELYINVTEEPLHIIELMLVPIFERMQEDDNLELTLASYVTNAERIHAINALLEHYIAIYIPEQEETEEKMPTKMVPKEPRIRAKFVQIFSENDIIQAFKDVRLVIDLHQEPDNYIQIAAISAGIPQVNKTQTDYVTHKENGYILTDITELPLSLEYFLTGLANWNKALVYSIDQINENTGNIIVNKWQSMLSDTYQHHDARKGGQFNG